MITHIVLFKLADPDAATLAALQDRLRGMAGRIPVLRHLEVGMDIIRSDRSYDIALVARFDSLDDLQAYQVHPCHADEVLPLVKSVCSSIIAVDYEGSAG
jgi:hypothetical protein